MAGSFDLVHSCLVLQHIPVTRGEPLIQRLVELLTPGGRSRTCTGSVRAGSLPLRRAVTWARGKVPGVHGVLNRLRGAPWGQPLVQMNPSALGRLHRLFETSGIVQIHTRLTRDGQYHGSCSMPGEPALLRPRALILPSVRTPTF